MNTVTLKDLAKNLIDTMSEEKVFLLLNYLRKQDEQERPKHSVAEEFPFDNLVHHTARADQADTHIREIRDYDRS